MIRDGDLRPPTDRRPMRPRLALTAERPEWVSALCAIALAPGTESAPLRDRFFQVAPDLDDPRLIEWIVTELESATGLLTAWQQYSYDKRASPSPYLDGREVGFFSVVDGEVSYLNVRRHESAAAACADFIAREAAWVMYRRDG